MSEYSESYHLRSQDQGDGVRLLQAAGVNGLVYPPSRGWVTVLAEGEPFVFNAKLLAANQTPLLYYWCAEDHGWGFVACDANRIVSQYHCLWEGEIEFDDSLLNLTALTAWLRNAGIAEGFHGEGSALFYPDSESLLTPDLPAERFASALQLDHYQWHSYEYMAPEYDQDKPECKGVVAIFQERGLRRTESTLPESRSSAKSSSFLLPVILYGDAPTTRKNWKKITTKAWKAGSWDGILDELEMAPVDSQPGKICLMVSSGSPRSGEKLWRLYWIPELLKDAAIDDKKLSRLDAMERLDTLMLSGMDRFWFTVGLLQSGNGAFNLGHWERKIPFRESELRYLARFVEWLPEFETLPPWIYDDLVWVEELRSRWAMNIRECAYPFGHWIDIKGMQMRHRGSLAAAMMAAGVVTRDGDRYRLAPPPTVSDLITSLTSPDACVRDAAVNSLGALQAAAIPAIPALIELLESDDDDRCRTSAANVLAGFGPAAAGAIPKLIAILQGNSHHSLRFTAASAVAAMGDAAREVVPVLIELLEDHEFAGFAVIALANLGPLAKDAIPALKSLADSNSMHRIVARRAIEQIKNQKN